MEWFVCIRSYESGKVVKRLGPYASERTAEKADSGVNRNLNHEQFYTVISNSNEKGNENEA